jgi:hypothetical protein
LQVQNAANQPAVLVSPPATPPPVTPVAPVTPVTPPSPLAGIFKSTNGNGTTLGFVGQSPPARIAYTDGTLANGVFSTALGGQGPLTIPLVAGTASFGPSATASPLGPVSGTFLSADGTFFYANLTPVNAPTQR